MPYLLKPCPHHIVIESGTRLSWRVVSDTPQDNSPAHQSTCHTVVCMLIKITVALYIVIQNFNAVQMSMRGTHIWTCTASIAIANYTACTNAPSHQRGVPGFPLPSHQRGVPGSSLPLFPDLISYQVLQYNIFTQSAVSSPFLLETLYGLLRLALT